MSTRNRKWGFYTMFITKVSVPYMDKLNLMSLPCHPFYCCEIQIDGSWNKKNNIKFQKLFFHLYNLTSWDGQNLNPCKIIWNMCPLYLSSLCFLFCVMLIRLTDWVTFLLYYQTLYNITYNIMSYRNVRLTCYPSQMYYLLPNTHFDILW